MKLKRLKLMLKLRKRKLMLKLPRPKTTLKRPKMLWRRLATKSNSKTPTTEER